MGAMMARQLLVLKEHDHPAPTRQVEEVISKRGITLIERALKVKLEEMRHFWRYLARLILFMGSGKDQPSDQSEFNQ